jgi:zinc protease
MSLMNMRIHTYTALCTLIFALIGCAQTPVSPKEYATAPAAGAPREARIEVPLERTLANGLRVVVAQRKGLPIVSTQLLVLTGAEADPKGMAGLAEMTASLLTKGTSNMTATQIAQAAEALGGSLGAGAGWHRSSIGITVTTPKLDAALQLMAASALRPAFEAQELDRLRMQAEDGLSVALADPGRLASIAATRALYGEQTYGNMVGGNPASLKRLSIAEVKRHYAQHFHAGNAALVFAGDISLDQAVALAQTHFGAWTRSAVAVQTRAATSLSAGAPIVIDMPEAGQAGVTVSWPSVTTQSPDFYAGVVSNAVLGGGYSSRLNQEIRIKRGLSYSAGSRNEVRRNAGTQRASAQTKNESAVEVLKLMQAELAQLANTPPSAEELRARKATLIGSYSRGLETSDGIAGEIASAIVNGEPVSAMTQTIGKINAVTAEQVSAFAKTYAKPELQRVVIAGDARQFGAALKAAMPNTLMVNEKSLDLDAALLGAK